MRVALGESPGDLAIVNARLANVYTGEVQENQLVVTCDKWIAYCGDNRTKMIDRAAQIIDAAGKVVIPGFIDGHTHLPLFFNIPEFLKFAVPGGTTTVITEACEPYAVGGCDGFSDFLDSLADQPIKLFATVPPMVSISPCLVGMAPDDLKRLLARQEILGMGEAYWQGVFQHPDKLLPIMQATLAAGKTLEGHTAGAKDEKLAAYAAIGVTSCHEPITAEEVRSRLRMGMHVMAREGNVRRDLQAIARILDMGVDLRRLTIASDGVDPHILINEGYMERLVRKAIDYGFSPMQAIQMTTLNVAEHFSIDHLVGGIAPGRYADMVVLPDLDEIAPELVISNGRVVAEKGRLIVDARIHQFSEASRRTVHLPRALTAEDFAVCVDSREATVTAAVIEMVTDLVTREVHVALPVSSGEIHGDAAAGLNKVAAVDRKTVPGKLFTGLIKGFGLRAGAFAASVAWDTANLIVVGADEADMALCINRIREMQGGAVVASGGAITAELALPVLGTISDLSMDKLAERTTQINQAVRSLGSPLADPMLTLATLTGAAIPFFRISEEGLVDIKTGAIKPVAPV